MGVAGAAMSTISDCGCGGYTASKARSALGAVQQFFAGELEVLCSLPEFWRKVTVIYSGGDDFAVYGSWGRAHRPARGDAASVSPFYTEENLKDYPGAEGKTNLDGHRSRAGDVLTRWARCDEDAGRNLDLAKAAD